MDLADSANKMIDTEKPWILVKTTDQMEHAHAVVSAGLNLFRILMTYLKPVLPVTAEKVEKFLNIAPMTWGNRQDLLCDHTILSFTPLLQRIQDEDIQTMKTTDPDTINSSE